MKKWILMMAVAMLAWVGCQSSQSPNQLVTSSEREAYRFGTYRAEFDTNLQRMDKVIRAVAKQAVMTQRKRENTLKSCHYLYSDINGNRVSIDAETVNDAVVRVSIRVGKTGDLESSRRLMEEINTKITEF